MIELMAVITIIGVLAAICIPVYQQYIAKTQLTRVYHEMKTLARTADLVMINGQFPTLDVSKHNKIENNTILIYIGSTPNQATSSLMSSLTINHQNHQLKNIQAILGNAITAPLHNTRFTITKENSGLWSCKVSTATSDGYLLRAVPTECSSE